MLLEGNLECKRERERESLRKSGRERREMERKKEINSGRERRNIDR